MLYQVVHSTLGRYRIRIPRLADDFEFSQKLSGLVESLQFVDEVRISPKASSLIVCYKVSKVNTCDIEGQLFSCIEQASIEQVNINPENIKQENFQQENFQQAKYLASTDIIEASPQLTAKESDLIPEINQYKDLGLPLLSLCLAILAAPLELPALLVVAAIAGAALPWFNRATDSIVNQHHPNIDLLDSAWMTLQTLQGQYIAPALKTSLVEFRRTLRGKVVQTREKEAFDLLNCLSQDVWVEENGCQQKIGARDLHAGDIITVYPGELVPVDGKIISGSGLMDCYVLTGMTTPVSCSEGQEVYASSLLIEGKLSVLVKRTGENTCIALANHLMQSAPVHNTKIGAHQAELVKSAIIPTLMLGGTIFATTGNLGAAISPFQFDFGSGIPISISTTLLSALTHATRNGVYIRTGRILEILAKIDTLVISESVLMQLIEIDTDVPSAVASLQKQGVTIYLISSYNLKQTIALAERFAIHPDHILINSYSQRQIDLVKGLRTQGKTVGVVDYCCYSCADISISLAPVGHISEETADVVLLDHQLWGLVYGIAIAKRAMGTIFQNTATIVVPNLMMQIGGGMFLGVNPVWNVIVNNGSAFVAEFLYKDFESPQPTAYKTPIPHLKS
jgi:cation transport ATPase